MADTQTLLQTLTRLHHDLQTNSATATREQMLETAQALVTSLQTPSEFISCVGWSEPAKFACVRMAIDLKVFDILDRLSDGKGVKVAELARETGAEEGLLARIMKHLAATHVVVETGRGCYANTTLSKQFTEQKYSDGIVYCYDVASPSFRQMPEYLKSTGYKQPLSPVDGPFQHAHDTKLHFFPWLEENPAYLGAFANYMSGYRAGKKPWFMPDFYPVQERLLDGSLDSDPPNVLLVDVGGGKGHDLLAFQSHFESPGRLILQDKPEVIESVSPPLPDTIQAEAHDFFTPQPVKGACAYFLHSVLHDWDDESCIKILKALIPALTPGYSKVLVHDIIVPDQKAAWSVTSMDWLMMALGSVRERTEADFRMLFEKAGLQIEKIWSFEQGTESLIEAVLPK